MNFRPRVLVIDDLVGKELPEEIDRQNRSDYCRSLGLWDEVTPTGPNYSIVADAFISSGQRITPSGTVNNLEMIEQDFSAGWPDPSGRFWSAVLVDMKFGDDSHFGLRNHRIDSPVVLRVADYCRF